MSLYEERKRLEQEDGEPLHTLRVTPDSEVAVQCNSAGVLVVAGEGGLTKDLEERIVKPLAEFGYFVVAIDLVRDRPATIDPSLAINDIAAAMLYLKELAGGKLGVIGFDAAAGVVMEAATQLPQIDCVVVAGGSGPRKGTRLNRVRCSILVHRGTKSSPLTDAIRKELLERIQPAMQTLMVQDYDASGGFFAHPVDDEERDYATEAFDHTTSFLSQNLI